MTTKLILPKTYDGQKIEKRKIHQETKNYKYKMKVRHEATNTSVQIDKDTRYYIGFSKRIRN